MDKSTEFSAVLLKTRAAFLGTSILRAPFWAIYNLLLFILYKDLNATPFQIALFIALKPFVSIFSIYWSAPVTKRPDRLLSNIIWAGVLGYLPFLAFPFFYNSWFIIFASAVFMCMHRGVVPAWMEIFKRNLPGASKEKIFSYGSMISCVVGAVLPFIIGPLLDKYALCWRYVFFAGALIGMLAILLQLRIPVNHLGASSPLPAHSPHPVTAPWKNAWRILSLRPDFRAYQIGFMIFGGCGLMIMQPALPKFFIDVLGLSYTELSIALTLCKGAGFAFTSQLWAGTMQKTDVFRFSSLVTFLAALFPLILLVGQVHVLWIYAAYFAYGVMQAGSELSWHLSGPIFAKEEDSSLFSSINLMTVGLRGCIIPQIGSVLCLMFPSVAILIIGAFLCFFGAGWLINHMIKKPALN